MRDIGINMNLIPVVDLWPANRSYPVLDDRSFGDDPEKVSDFATMSIEEFKRFGILTCAKHFPGLGSAGGDPHKIMATSDESLERFIDYHWKPFKTAATAGVNCVMTTHLFCGALDSENCATYSPNIISHLRNTVGHRGPIISDDLYMGGARNNTPMGVAAVRSIAAGHNLLIISRGARLQGEAMEFIKKRFDEDDSFGKIAIANEGAIEKLFETR
jgi:beta-glucosidase-like glycosyl hydrolase